MSVAARTSAPVLANACEGHGAVSLGDQLTALLRTATGMRTAIQRRGQRIWLIKKNAIAQHAMG